MLATRKEDNICSDARARDYYITENDDFIGLEADVVRYGLVLGRLGDNE